MDKSKAILLIEKLVFVYLLLFPFGQLLAFNAVFWGSSIRVHPTDVVVLFALPLVALAQLGQPKFFVHAKSLVLLGVFGLVLSLIAFEKEQVALGALYFVRACSYAAFFAAIYSLVASKIKYKEILHNALIIVSMEVALLGFIQYFLLPDLRFLFAFGWDDHLFRLVGTFLDPGFTGIILAFGGVLALASYLKSGKKIFLWALIFLGTALLLTYSRASFIAFALGIGVVYLKTKRNLILLAGAIFLLAIPLLPRPEGYGVKLERTHSIVSRITNYQETLRIIQKSPVFGVGFNNMCAARRIILGDKMGNSHACSGSDSSILLILATGGVVGLIMVSYLLKDMLVGLPANYYSYAFLACFIALIIHSQFVNSLIYPWVLGYMSILGGLSLGKTKERS